MIDLIKNEVSIYDLFDRSSPPVRYETDKQQCQISCPFHGYDNSPSARVYPESNSLYCWACAKSWDVIDYWAEANQWEKDGHLDRGRAIRDLIAIYGLKNKRHPWKSDLFSSLNNLDKKAGGYGAYTQEEKNKAIAAFSWAAAKDLSVLDKDRREIMCDDFLKMWDEFDSIDCGSSDWRSQYKGWLGRLRVLLSS